MRTETDNIERVGQGLGKMGGGDRILESLTAIDVGLRLDPDLVKELETEIGSLMVIFDIENNIANEIMKIFEELINREMEIGGTNAIFET